MFRRHLDMTSGTKTRGSLLDPADSNNGLNDPENDGGSFSETTSDPLRRAFRRMISGTTPAFCPNDPQNDPCPVLGNGGPGVSGVVSGRTRKQLPKMTSGSFLKTPPVDLAGSFRENDLEGRFRTTPWPFNIGNYHILRYNLMK
jgi:hypothetical protein